MFIEKEQNQKKNGFDKAPKLSDVLKNSKKDENNNGLSTLSTTTPNHNESNVFTNENTIHKKQSKSQHKIPSIVMFGCGGCGTNLVQKYYRTFSNDKINYYVIDTSLSNYDNDLGLELVNIQLGSVGSGKFRQENYNAIASYLENFVKSVKTKLSDICIIVFSASGGSGSIIGPLLTKELLKLNKRIILITVTNNISEIDIVNSLNTLMTLNNISRNFYIPIGLFDNSKERNKVDNTILDFLDKNINILLSEANEIDYTDKMNWLRPNKVLNTLTNGLHLMLTINSEEDKVDKNEFLSNKLENGYILPNNIESIDSFFIIRKEVKEYNTNVPVRLIYQGYDFNLEEEYIGSLILPYSIPQDFISSLNDKLEYLRNHNTNENITFSNDSVNEIDGDIVL